MTIQGHDSLIEVRSIGEAALSALSNTQGGSVLASMTNAAYLLSEQGELCWLVPMSAPMHKRGLQLAEPLPRLSVGSRYEVGDHSFVVDSGDTIDFHNARIWMPPVVSPNEIVPISRLSESLKFVVDRLLAQQKPSGLGDLIKVILQLIDHPDGAVEISHRSVFTKKAWPSIKGIILAAWEKDADLMIHYAKALVGFGEGLTPSGDDFLGGFFFSMRLFNQYYPKAVNIPICTYSDFIHQSNTCTNLISYTILKDHAGGHTVEPLHQLANGLYLGKPVDQLIFESQKLISLGHSTGWDILTGFLAGMSVTLAQLHSMSSNSYTSKGIFYGY